jgi:hypothetical protein
MKEKKIRGKEIINLGRRFFERCGDDSLHFNFSWPYIVVIMYTILV